MSRITTQGVSLRQLARLFDKRIFAVPELQREFAWDASKACQLLDSIYRGYPIGNALVWKTSRRDQTLLRKTLHILPNFDDRNPDIYFLVDGQQRLSVLWQVLRGSGHELKNASGTLVNFGCIYFLAGADEGVTRFVYRMRPTGDFVAVVDLLSNNWRSRVSSLGKRAAKRAETGRQRILDYKFWLTSMETNSLSEVRETFVRINSQGTPIKTADRAFARATALNLRHLVREVQSGLGHGFDAMSTESLLVAIALARGASDIGERAIDSMVSDLESTPTAHLAFSKTWRSLKHSIGHAVDYLVNQFGVANYGFLPSNYLVVVLSQYFFRKGNGRPSSVAGRILCRWFWSTIVGTRYAGRGHRPNVLADVQLMQRRADGKNVRFQCAKTPLRVLRAADYSRRSMLTDGYFCLLRLAKPRYLEDGEPVPIHQYSTRANRHDKHHIFPRKLLTNRNFGAGDYNCIANICFLVARENQRIGSRAPGAYLAIGDLPQGKRARGRALKSHLIPATDACGLWDTNIRRGFRMFISARIAVIAKHFEEQAGTKLFARD